MLTLTDGTAPWHGHPTPYRITQTDTRFLVSRGGDPVSYEATEADAMRMLEFMFRSRCPYYLGAHEDGAFR
jgi:hypothetical protein